MIAPSPAHFAAARRPLRSRIARLAASLLALAVTSGAVVSGLLPHRALAQSSATLPRISSVEVPASATYAADQELSFTVRFSAAVRVEQPSPATEASAPYFTWSAVVSTGQQGSSGQVRYASGSGTTALVFRYKVKSTDLAPNGITLGVGLQLPAGTEIRDAATGVALPLANLTLPWPQPTLTGVLLVTDRDGDTGKKKQVIVLKPVPSAGIGNPTTLDATTSSGQPITWQLVSGNATLVGNVLTPRNRGAVVLRATVAGDATYAGASTLINIDAREKRQNRLVNLSSRLRVTGGDASRSVVAGFVVTGTAPKQILIRAIGPGLAGFGVRDALAQPRLQLRDGTGRLVAEADDWTPGRELNDAFDRTGAFKLNPGSRDAVLLLSLAPGAYTAQISANGNGIALVEVYDATSGTPLDTDQLVNISTRGFVDTGEGQLIAGFVVTGDAPKRVLIRGIGPGLTAFGVTGALADPELKLFSGPNAATPLAQNDNWGTPLPIAGGAAPATSAEIVTATTAAGAFPLAASSKDAALLVTLAPGNYSAVMSGTAGATGAGLVEVYEVP